MQIVNIACSHKVKNSTKMKFTNVKKIGDDILIYAYPIKNINKATDETKHFKVLNKMYK